MNDNVSTSIRKTSSRHKSPDKQSIHSSSINLEFKGGNKSKNKKKTHSSTGNVSKQNKKRVVFKKNIAEIINVECWKKYNMDISESVGDDSDKDKTKCTCLIF